MMSFLSQMSLRTHFTMLLALAVSLGAIGCAPDEVSEPEADNPKPAPKVVKKAITPEAEPVPEEEKPEEKKPLVVRSADPPPPPPTSEDVAAEEVKKRGGKVEYNRNDNVHSVDWQGAEITDNDLVLLQGFPYLTDLNLSGTPITDEGLNHLKPLKWLRHLYLLGTPVTDKGMPALNVHSRLDQLCLDETQVSDEGVKELKPLSRLVMLHLATQGKITDATIDTLVELKELKEIKLEGTEVTEDGKAKLQKALPDVEFMGQLDEGIPID